MAVKEYISWHLHQEGAIGKVLLLESGSSLSEYASYPAEGYSFEIEPDDHPGFPGAYWVVAVR